MDKTRLTIKNAATFTLSGYISSICNFVSAVIVRRILDPLLMGIYAELLLVFEYAKYSHLGMIDSLDRQIPYYNGRKEFQKAEEAKNAGISFSLLTSLICAIAIIALSYILKGKLSPSLFVGLKVIAMLVVVQVTSSFYVTLVRTHHLFGPLSGYIIIVAVFDIFFKAILGIKFGIIGILWGTTLSLIIGLLALYKWAGLRFRISFKVPRGILKVLLGIGFPLLLAGFTFMALRSIDRIMIIALLTKKDLGYYSIAVMMHSFVFQLPNLIYTVLFPRFYEKFGSSKDNINEVKGLLEKPALAFAYIFPILLGIAAILLPVFINYVLPKYDEGIIPAIILLFGTFFISITNMSGYLLIALKKQNTLVLIGIICVVISVFLNFIFVKTLHFGIRGVALGTSLTYFLYSLFLLSQATKYYIKSLYDRIKFLIQLYLPLAWILFVFYIFKRVFVYNFKSPKADIGNALFQILTFLILTFPLLVYVNRKISLYQRIKNAGFNFFKK